MRLLVVINRWLERRTRQLNEHAARRAQKAIDELDKLKR